MTKAQYVKPTMEKIGSFETITQSTSTGFNLDAAFPTDSERGPADGGLS